MALPSILLLLAFVGGVFATAGFALVMAAGPDHTNNNPQLVGLIGAVSAAVAGAGAWLHWRRFHVPITVAAGAGSVAAIAVGLLVAALGQNAESARNLILGFVLLLGIGMFLFAMWWDASDRGRITRRSDVAFWLHLLAAPMIVHPIFTLLGLTSGHISVAEGLAVVLLYVVLGVTAVAVDRRALLVSALAYVLYALNELFRQFGAVELNVALTALVIGSALLLLSAFWHQARGAIVRPLPESLQSRLPLLDRTVPANQPAA
jgi:cytochrome bd-type quinol oxidase subunit 2